MMIGSGSIEVELVMAMVKSCTDGGSRTGGRLLENAMMIYGGSVIGHGRSSSTSHNDNDTLKHSTAPHTLTNTHNVVAASTNGAGALAAHRLPPHHRHRSHLLLSGLLDRRAEAKASSRRPPTRQLQINTSTREQRECMGSGRKILPPNRNGKRNVRALGAVLPTTVSGTHTASH